ncbi:MULTISPECIES: DeoR/GlpR family DNA-binding transcription regulator [unclassified Clostridium]|uniref:DeoR/GlpR family DNA-binding transcription regulator n=1 Tax=unclassified Clostridium TaxID=2614128 RepID=UPI0011063E40|nr:MULTISPECIES: DeoR/GlpR family DNA-binding transcription regulator [unclassified Clostridium]
MRTKRIEAIQNYIYEHNTVSLDQLCEKFGVSKNTIRRDVEELTGTGRFKKTYGGVMVQTKRTLVSFSQRNIENLRLKKRIARRASRLVADGDVIFLDSGTTTVYMVECLKDVRNVTVLTNNLQAIVEAIPCENLNVISLSGTLNRETLSFTGTSALQILSRYNVNKAFMASAGISVPSGVTHSSPAEFDIKQHVMSTCPNSILLVDHTKFDTASLMTYAPLQAIGTLVTDAQPPQSIVNCFGENGHTIIVTEE